MRKNVFLPLGAIALLIGGLLTSPLAAAADPAVTSVTGAMAVDANMVPTGSPLGTSQLVRDDTGLTFTLSTSKLTPLNVYTVWWMISGADNKPFLISYASGALALPDGTATFGGRLPIGPVAAANGTTVRLNSGPGGKLESSRGIKVEFVVRDHGPILVTSFVDQLTTFDGGCPPNTCKNVQLASHAP